MTRTVVSLLVLAVALHAQFAGTISGFVKDQTGAVVPGASITAVLTGQQLTRTAVSDSTGFYNLLSMQPGVYEVTTAAQGFDKEAQGGVGVTSGEHLRLDWSL